MTAIIYGAPIPCPSRGQQISGVWRNDAQETACSGCGEVPQVPWPGFTLKGFRVVHRDGSVTDYPPGTVLP